MWCNHSLQRDSKRISLQAFSCDTHTYETEINNKYIHYKSEKFMKKSVLLFLCIITAVIGRAAIYDFTAEVDGITFYLKITDEANREVALAQNDAGNAYLSLTKLVIPDKVKNINDNNKEYSIVDIYAFSGAYSSSITEITLPNTLKYLVGWNSFNALDKVKKLVIPAGVQNVVSPLFDGASLEEVYLLPATPPTPNAPSPNPFYGAGSILHKLSVYTAVDKNYIYKSDMFWAITGWPGDPAVPYYEQITLNANGYASLYLENENFEVPTGCTAYIIKGMKNSTAFGGYPAAKVVAFGAGSILPRQTPFILENIAEKGKTIKYRAYVTGTEEDVSNNLLIGTANANGEEFSDGSSSYYIFANGQFGQGFYYQGTRQGASVKVKPHRAALRIPAGTQVSASSKAFFIDFEAAKEQLTTSIRQLPHVAPASKEDVIFDLQGRRVLHPTRGIYIINGKKVVKE